MSSDLHYITGAPVLYVAGPMRQGDPNYNVQRGANWAMHLLKLGWIVVVPQLSNYWATISGNIKEGHPDGADGWLEFDFNLVARSDALLRLTGPSSGADRELALAKELNMITYTGETGPMDAAAEAKAGFPSFPTALIRKSLVP